MPRSVGVELTPLQVRILSLERSGKSTKILRYHEAPIPAGEGPWETRAAAALKQACADAKIPRGRVVAALDSGDAILREVSLPFKGEDQIRKTVRFEMESLIHNYTIEQLVVSHYKNGETEKGSLLLAAAVPKTVVGKRLQLFQDAGLDPLALDLDVAAVFNAMSYAGAIDSDEPQLLVYGTPKFTKLVFIEEKRPRSIRTIRFSMTGEPAAPALPAAAGEEPAAAEPEFEPLVMVTESDHGVDGLAPEQQRGLIGILAKEISRFLLANAASSSPSHILLSGDIENDESAALLEAATRIPVKRFNLLKAVDPSFTGAAAVARVAAPLGLALKGAGVDALGMDFRQDEFQYTKKFEAVKTTALVSVELLIVLLAAIALHFYFVNDEVRRNTGTVLEAQKSLYESVKGDTLTDRSMAFPKMSELYRLAQASQGADLPIKASAREAWRDLFNAIQRFQQKHGDKTLGDGTLYLELESLDLLQNTAQGNESLTLTLKGKIRNLEFAGLLKNELRTVELFANADFVGSLPRIADSDLVQFTLKASKGGRN